MSLPLIFPISFTSALLWFNPNSLSLSLIADIRKSILLIPLNYTLLSHVVVVALQPFYVVVMNAECLKEAEEVMKEADEDN